MHEMYQSYMYKFKDMNNLDLPVYRQRLQNQIGFHALCFLKLVHQSWKTTCRPTWWCTCMPIELLLCSCADQNIGERIKGEVSLSNYCMPCLNYDLNLNKESMQVISAYWTNLYHISEVWFVHKIKWIFPLDISWSVIDIVHGIVGYTRL